MTTQNYPSRPASTNARPSRAAGWVIAALAVHLLASTMATAATSCSGTIERTRVTRLTHSVAQAIRELVEHSEERPSTIIDPQHAPVAERLFKPTEHSLVARSLSPWLLNLPPPLAA